MPRDSAAACWPTSGSERLIAESRVAYVDSAVRLAGDLPALATLRSQLRPRMAASPLVDAQGFARNLEQAYLQMWRTWCQGGILYGGGVRD